RHVRQRYGMDGRPICGRLFPASSIARRQPNRPAANPLPAQRARRGLGERRRAAAFSIAPRLRRELGTAGSAITQEYLVSYRCPLGGLSTCTPRGNSVRGRNFFLLEQFDK